MIEKNAPSPCCRNTECESCWKKMHTPPGVRRGSGVHQQRRGLLTDTHAHKARGSVQHQPHQRALALHLTMDNQPNSPSRNCVNLSASWSGGVRCGFNCLLQRSTSGVHGEPWAWRHTRDEAVPLPQRAVGACRVGLERVRLKVKREDEESSRGTMKLGRPI